MTDDSQKAIPKRSASNPHLIADSNPGLLAEQVPPQPDHPSNAQSSDPNPPRPDPALPLAVLSQLSAELTFATQKVGNALSAHAKNNKDFKDFFKKNLKSSTGEYRIFSTPDVAKMDAILATIDPAKKASLDFLLKSPVRYYLTQKQLEQWGDWVAANPAIRDKMHDIAVVKSTLLNYTKTDVTQVVGFVNDLGSETKGKLKRFFEKGLVAFMSRQHFDSLMVLLQDQNGELERVRGIVGETYDVKMDGQRMRLIKEAFADQDVELTKQFMALMDQSVWHYFIETDQEQIADRIRQLEILDGPLLLPEMMYAAGLARRQRKTKTAEGKP